MIERQTLIELVISVVPENGSRGGSPRACGARRDDSRDTEMTGRFGKADGSDTRTL